MVSRAASDNAPVRTRVYGHAEGHARLSTSQVLADIVATLKQQFREKFALDITKRVKILVRNDTR